MPVQNPQPPDVLRQAIALSLCLPLGNGHRGVTSVMKALMAARGAVGCGWGRGTFSFPTERFRDHSRGS